MSNVVFEEDETATHTHFQSVASDGASGTSGTVRFLIDKGIVKGVKEANLLLVGIALICIATAVGLIVVDYTKPAPVSSATSFEKLPDEIRKTIPSAAQEHMKINLPKPVKINK